ncbi:MAG: right-handed parallel beta-helix repeat-containing protein, partial [Planctomycetota bacterium]
MAGFSEREIADAVEAVTPQPGGQVLVVECQGNYDYETIQGAINAASNGDTIVVMPNTCTPQEAYVENIDYLGKAITVQALSPTDAAVVEVTIIDGDQSGSVVTFQSGEGSGSVLNGFTITNGSATQGGGIHCRTSSPSIRNCVVTDNTASSRGGGVYCGSNSHPTLYGCRLSSNSSGNTGGGMD